MDADSMGYSERAFKDDDAGMSTREVTVKCDRQ